MRWWCLGLLVVVAGCAQRPCSPATCDGCCASETECVEGTTRLECGQGGEACTRCTSQERCIAQRCEPAPPMDAGIIDAGPPPCTCMSSCCLPDGSCAGNNSIDACGAQLAFCGQCIEGQRCERGECVPGDCGGCLDPLGRCRSGLEASACGSDGGVCVACGVDQACSRGRCIFTRCELSNCRFGCCLPDKTCVTPSAQACGTAGAACVTCAMGAQCLAGQCQ